MTPLNVALDRIVAGLASIDARLSGDDSPLANPWEEIKEQLQHGLSAYWSAYLATIQQFVDGYLGGLSAEARIELETALKCRRPERLSAALLRRVLARGKREKIRYEPFDFKYFSYWIGDLAVYAQVIERTGLDECLIEAFSAAAPLGEQGVMSTARIDSILTHEDFEAARQRRWESAPE